VELDNDFVQPWIYGFNPIDTPSSWKYLAIDVAKQQRGHAMARASK